MHMVFSIINKNKMCYFNLPHREFLDGTTIYDVNESDYIYEYEPRSRRPRPDYLSDEIKCLEATLAKRRAELREADRLLLECEADLIDVRKEVRGHSQQSCDLRRVWCTVQ